MAEAGSGAVRQQSAALLVQFQMQQQEQAGSAGGTDCPRAELDIWSGSTVNTFLPKRGRVSLELEGFGVDFSFIVRWH